MNRRAAQKRITDFARGMPCQIRIMGVCNGDTDTTVPCHLRLSGISGMGLISPSLFVAHGCSACHAYVDANHDVDTKLAFAHGIFRTQALLLKRGVIQC